MQCIASVAILAQVQALGQGSTIPISHVVGWLLIDLFSSFLKGTYVINYLQLQCFRSHLSMAQLMAQVAVDSHMYEQAGFVSQYLMYQWAESYFTLGPVFDWIGIPEAVANAVCFRMGCARGDHVSTVAHVSFSDWEMMVTSPDLGVQLTMVGRSKVRQVMTAARCVMGMVEIKESAAPSSGHRQLTDTSDDLLTVEVSEVGLQSSDAKVLLISEAEVKEGIVRYFKAEGGKAPHAEAPTR